MRLAVPLILGIVTGWACNVNALHVSVMFLASGTALLTGLLRSAPRWLFGVGAMLVMFSAGMLSEQGQSMEKEPQWDGVRREYRAELVEMPAVRGTNVKVLAEVSTLPDTLQVARSRGLVYLYFSRSEESGALKAGDILSFKGSIQPPRNQGNPAEFDIEKYYYIKGITGTAFVNDGMWSFADVSSPGLRARALELRAAVVGMYRRLGFEGERLALLSALTLGEKRDFPKELKESYSVAGASHILALSGLHLGILYMLLTMLLPLHRRGLLYRVLREALVVGLLWGFAFVAGLAPSVVRAAILFTLMSAGRLIGQEVSSVNSLSFAAIAMLLFSPHLLFDVSFQLSFAAVLSILLLAPPLQAIFRVYEHGVLYAYVVNLLILSFVAQAGTLPFVWYYFGVFPLYFLLTNLFVVPLSFVLMLLAVAVWMLAPIAFLQSAVAWMLSAVVDVMNWGVEAVASLPGGSFLLPPLGLFRALLMTFALLLLVVALLHRRVWLILLSSGLVLLFVLSIAMDNNDVDEEDGYMLLYNNRKNPLVHLVFSGGENYLLSTVPQSDAEYEGVSMPYVKRGKLRQPVWVDWGYADSIVQYNDGLFSFGGLSVRLLDNAHWRENVYAAPVDILVLCRGFLGSVKEVVEVYPASCVVLDGSLYSRSRERILRECSLLGVDAVDVALEGAMKVVVTSDGFDLIPMRGK